MKKYKYFLIALSIVLIFSGIFYILNNSSDYEMSMEKSEQEILNNCSNLSLKHTCRCFVENVRSFFNYNKTNINVSINEMDFERLKAEGGVCRHYNRMYERWGKELGFLDKHLSLPEINHGFAVLYDEENKDYCILDQTSYFFKGLG